MFDTLGRSWELTKESYRVLMQDKELMWFPVISAVLSIIVLVSFAVPVVFIYKNGEPSNIVNLIILFCFYSVNYFIIVFSNVAILHCASIRFKGGDPVFMDGIRAGLDNLGRIAAWSAIGGTIGVLLAVLEDKLGDLVGGIIRKIVGGLWSVVTFFAVPVMIFEKTSPWDAIKRSVDIIKKTWGESLAVYIGFGAISGWLGFAGFLVLVMSFVISAVTNQFIFVIVTGVGVVLYWIALAIVFSSLTQIFRAALYQYATTGAIPSSFSESNIKDAFKVKKGNRFL
ncbi:MAG: DUF6159 family protein [Candidatus Xenobiia bacterium LiM19]